MTIDMRDALALDLCEDCSNLEETGDATGFYCHYTEPESTARLTSCEEGWAALRSQGDVFNDTTDAVERMCHDCGHVEDEADFPPGEDSCGYSVDVCPACGSFDTSQRLDGHDEFSWSPCDCCGSSLGGSRTRYALFPRAPEPPPAGAAGSVAIEQVEGPAG